MSFLKNTWYVAGHAYELAEEGMISRKICNQDIVMFRTSNLDEHKQTTYGFTTDDVEGQGHSRWDAPGVLLVETA